MSDSHENSHDPSKAFFGIPVPAALEPGRVQIRHAGPLGTREPARIALSMTSMIDVVFLLLIYFLIATDFRVGEEIYRLDLPNREGVSQQDPFELDDEPLRIAVASTGLGPQMYQLRIDGPYPQPANFESLFEFLRDKQVNESNLAAGALFEPGHPIIIQPAHSARWEHAIEAFNSAARARYTNITFAKSN